MSSDVHEPGESPNLIAKLVGGLFALIVAPILVTVGSGLLQKKLEEGAEAPPKAAVATPPVADAKPSGDARGPSAPAAASAKPASADPGKAVAGPPGTATESSPGKSESAPAPAPPIRLAATPERPREAGVPGPSPESKDAGTKLTRKGNLKKAYNPLLRLLSANDFTGFDRFAGPPSTADKKAVSGVDHDPSHLFTVQDRQLHVSGQLSGVLETKQEYGDYHLSVEYHFGAKVWPPGEGALKRSGILIHALGSEEGTGSMSWRVGFKVVINEQTPGGLLLPTFAGRDLSMTVEAEKAAVAAKKKIGKKVGRYHFQPGAAPVVLAQGVVDPKPGVEPKEGWNRLECICEGDKLTVLLNGQVVNVATRLNRSRGKIGFASDNAEIFFRNLNLRPLPGARPPANPPQQP
jgi:hypothetical protein